MTQRRAPRNETRYFLQRHARGVIVAAAVVTVVIVAVGIWAGYHYKNAWTGFRDYPASADTSGRFERGKTLWDWMDLLIVPVVLAGGALWFNRRASKRDRDRETTRHEQNLQMEQDRQQETILQTFYDRMSDLILSHGLSTSNADEAVRVIATARAISALAELDSKRKTRLMGFLNQANLVGNRSRSGEEEEPQSSAVVGLDRADLQGVFLRRANLEGVFLHRANLKGANLSRAALQGANLHHAELQGADLTRARLQGAILRSADLQGASLNHAELQGANLLRTNLQDVSVEDASLDGKTILPDETNYDPQKGLHQLDRFIDPARPDFWRSDNPRSPAYKGKAADELND